MAGQTLDYEALNNSFSDTDMNNWILSEHVENYISYCIGLDRDKKMNTIKFVPDVYLPNTKPGARSPLSVEAAQNMMYKLSNAYEDALARETRRATSSEQSLSKFMKDNMVTKSEDQTITGDKELTGHTTVKDLNVTTRLNIPQGAPSNPQVGDIWYDPTVSSPNDGQSTVVETRTISFHDEDNTVSMYDGSSYVGAFKTDNTVDDISLDGKTIKIPKGINLENFKDTESISFEKNTTTNDVKISVKDEYVRDLITNRVNIALTSINDELTTLSERIENKSTSLDAEILKLENADSENEQAISDLTSNINAEISEIRDLLTQSMRDINILSSSLNQTQIDTESLSSRIDTINEELSSLKTRIYNLENAD